MSINNCFNTQILIYFEYIESQISLNFKLIILQDSLENILYAYKVENISSNWLKFYNLKQLK